jgi:hypothetical protein
VARQPATIKGTTRAAAPVLAGSADRLSWPLRATDPGRPRPDESPQPASAADMIVTFRTKAYSDITMFGDVAVKLLRMMGHSGTVPGAITAEDVEGALERLKAAVAREPERPAEDAQRSDDDAEPVISLRQRAYPLIQLLEAAAREDCYVRWDSGKWP